MKKNANNYFSDKLRATQGLAQGIGAVPGERWRWHGRGWFVEAVAGRVEARKSGLGTGVSRVTARCGGAEVVFAASEATFSAAEVVFSALDVVFSALEKVISVIGKVVSATERVLSAVEKTFSPVPKVLSATE